MTLTRIINRPDQRLASGEVEARGRTEDETNLTVASAIEGRFPDRKAFGRYVDELQAKVAPKRRRRK